MNRTVPGASGLLLFLSLALMAGPSTATPPAGIDGRFGGPFLAYPGMADSASGRGAPASGQSLSDQRGDLLLFQAETALRGGDFPDAVGLLQEVLSLEPGRTDALEMLALTYRLWDDSGEAPGAADSLRQASIDLYRELLEANPSHRPALDGIRLLTGHTDRPNPGRAGATATLGPPPDADAAATRAYWDEAVRRDPGSSEAWMGLAVTQEARGDSAAAETSLRIAFELSPENEDARDQLFHLEEALNARQSRVDRLVILGRIAQLDGRAAEALDRLTEAMRTDSSRAEVRKYYGIALYESGHEARALDYLKPIAESDPDDLDARYYIGSLLFRLGHLEEAFERLAPLTEEGTHQAEASRMAGIALMRTTAHHDVALELLERARGLGSRDGSIECLLGEEYVRLRRWADARRSFEACEKNAPGHPAALLGMGLVADQNGDYRQAIQYLETFLGKSEASTAVLMRLGICYLRLGQPDSAFVRLRASLEADSTFARLTPDSVSAQEVFEVSSLILSAGREFPDAIALGEHMVKTWPGEAGYANNLAMAYADGETNLPRALALAEDANRRSPDNAGYLDTLGWVQVRMKQWTDAGKTLNRALELAAGQPPRDLSEIYYHRGLMYAGMDQRDKAIPDLKRAAEETQNPWIRHSAERKLEELDAD